MSIIKSVETKAINALQAGINAQQSRNAAKVNVSMEKAEMYRSLGIDPDRLNLAVGFRLLGKKKQDEARSVGQNKTLLVGFSGSYVRYGKTGNTTSFGSLVIRKDYLDGKVDYAPLAFYSVDPQAQDPENASMYEQVSVIHTSVSEDSEEVISTELPVYRCWALDPGVWYEAMGFVTTTHLKMAALGAAMTSKFKGIYARLKDEESPGTVMIFLPYEASSFKANAEGFLKPVYGSQGERVYAELNINPAGLHVIPNSALPRAAKFNWGTQDELKTAHAAAMERNKEALGQAPKTVNRACMADLNCRFKGNYPHKDIIESYKRGKTTADKLQKVLSEMHSAAVECQATGSVEGVFVANVHLNAVLDATTSEAIETLLNGKAKTLAASQVGAEVKEELTSRADADDSVIDC